MINDFPKTFARRASASTVSRLSRSADRLQERNPGLRVYIEITPLSHPGPGVGLHALYDGRSLYASPTSMVFNKGKNALSIKLHELAAELLRGGGDAY